MSLNFHRAAIAASLMWSVVGASVHAGDSWVEIANSELDFALEQGVNGWTYGYAVGFGEPAPVELMQFSSPVPGCGCGAVGPLWHFAPTVCFCGQEFCFQGATTAHPDSQGEPHVPVRMYTFAETGHYRLQPTFFHGGGCQAAEDIRLELRFGGEVLWSAETDGGLQSGDLEVFACAGERLELWSVMLLGECGTRHTVKLSVSRADTEVISVGQEACADFTTIQAAYDAAPEGAVILVHPGTYATKSGPVLQTTSKGARILARNGADATVIDAQGRSAALYSNAGAQPQNPEDLIIEGFTITNSFGAAAVLGTCTLRDCVFTGNAAEAANSASAARVGSQRTAQFQGCRFENNTVPGAEHNGGTVVLGGCTARFSDCSFNANSGGRAPVAMDGATAQFDSCSFNKNVQSTFGAVWGWFSTMHLADCVVAENMCSSGGCLIAGSSSMRRTRFVGNVSSGGLNRVEGSILFEDCEFDNNDTTGVGGALDIWCSGPTIRRCTFTNNTAAFAGAVFVGGQAGCLVETVITDCDFEGNKAVATSGFGYPGDGGAIQIDRAWLSMARCSFVGNEAVKYGGAVRKWLGVLSMVDCDIRDNVGGLGGGGVAFAGENQAVTGVRACGNSPNDFEGPWTDLGGNRVGSDACACAADVNTDGAVDGGDLAFVLASWGPTEPGGFMVDIDANGLIDGADLASILAAWGPCE
jgi:hypothetical protein